MPFIPHTPDDIAHMLDAIGVEHISALFDEIPAQLLNSTLSRVPEGLNEMQVTRLMRERAARDGGMLNFIGAGAYEHHFPPAADQVQPLHVLCQQLRADLPDGAGRADHGSRRPTERNIHDPGSFPDGLHGNGHRVRIARG